MVILSSQPGNDGALRGAMRRLAKSAPPALAAGGFPRGWWRDLGGKGLLGVGFPSDGGATLMTSELSDLLGVLVRESQSLGLGLGWMMNEMLGRFVIAPHARNPDHTALLSKMARGETLLALAISEPGAGAHPKRLSTTARRDGDVWALDGHKAFISNGPAADAFVILAVSGEQDGRKSFDAFVVDASAPGLTRDLGASLKGLAPLGHCALQLKNCRVAEQDRLGDPGRAFDTIARPVRTIEDALIAGAIVGAMQAELDALADVMRAVAGDPALIRDLGALQLELEALSHLARHAARHLDDRGPDDALARLNTGLRRHLEYWQNACESLAAKNGLDAGALPVLARDLRTVLGIARSVAESRQTAAGEALLAIKDNNEKSSQPAL